MCFGVAYLHAQKHHDEHLAAPVRKARADELIVLHILPALDAAGHAMLTIEAFTDSGLARVRIIDEIIDSPALAKLVAHSKLTDEELTKLKKIALVLDFAKQQEHFVQAAMLDFGRVMVLICHYAEQNWLGVKKRTTMYYATLYLFLRHIRDVVAPFFVDEHTNCLAEIVDGFVTKSSKAKRELADFGNALLLLGLFLPLQDNKVIHMEVASWLATGVTFRYVTGSKQTSDTAERVCMYNWFSPETLNIADALHALYTLGQAQRKAPDNREAEFDVEPMLIANTFNRQSGPSTVSRRHSLQAMQFVEQLMMELNDPQQVENHLVDGAAGAQQFHDEEQKSDDAEVSMDVAITTHEEYATDPFDLTKLDEFWSSFEPNMNSADSEGG